MDSISEQLLPMVNVTMRDPLSSNMYNTSSSTSSTSEPEPPVHILNEIDWSSWSTVVKTIVLTLIVLGTIVGNSLVLLAMKLNRNKNLRSSTHFFIANLATADLFVGILVLPFLATLTISGNWYFGQTYCVLWAYTHFWLCSASILSVCAICVDRYVGVSFPIQHYRLMNKQKVLLISFTVWLLALCLGSIPLAVWPEEPSPNRYGCAVNQQLGHVLIASIGCIGILYIPTIIMVVLYGLIYKITCEHFKKRQDKLQQYQQGNGIRYNVGGGGGGGRGGTGSSSSDEYSSSNHSTSATSIRTKMSIISLSASSNGDLKNAVAAAEAAAEAAQRRESSGVQQPKCLAYVTKNSVISEQDQLVVNRARQIRIAKKLAIVVGAFIISYVPFFTVFLIRALDEKLISGDVFLAFGWIRYFNSCLNPIIYAAMLPAFTQSFKNILLCKFRK